MENQIQQSKHNLSTRLNSKEIEIAKIIYKVNMLVSYPLSDQQIEDWSTTLSGLYSELDLVLLSSIIKEFILDAREWDHRKGIQNITLAIRTKGIDDDETIRQIKNIEEEMYPTKRQMIY